MKIRMQAQRTKHMFHDTCFAQNLHESQLEVTRQRYSKSAIKEKKKKKNLEIARNASTANENYNHKVEMIRLMN